MPPSQSGCLWRNPWGEIRNSRKAASVWGSHQVLTKVRKANPLRDRAETSVRAGSCHALNQEERWRRGEAPAAWTLLTIGLKELTGQTGATGYRPQAIGQGAGGGGYWPKGVLVFHPHIRHSMELVYIEQTSRADSVSKLMRPVAPQLRVAQGGFECGPTQLCKFS